MPSSRLTPAATLVLDVLLEEPMHPYEILMRLTKRRDDLLVRLSAGAVYHAVEKLEAAGLVAEAGSRRCGNRPERTTYAITDEGRHAHAERARQLLVDRPAEYPAFPVGLALIHDLDPADAADRLRRRRDDLAAECALRRARLEAVMADGLPRRFLLDGLYAIHQTEAEIAWLTATLADLDSGALSWTDQPAAHFRATHFEAAPTAAHDKENS